MYNNCISCSTKLTEDNSYPKSYSCKACHKICNRNYRHKHKCVTRKEVQAVLAAKTCCICNGPDVDVLSIQKDISLYSLKELQKFDAYHFTCLFRCNTFKTNKKTG